MGFIMFSCGLLVRAFLGEHKYDRTLALGEGFSKLRENTVGNGSCLKLDSLRLCLPTDIYRLADGNQISSGDPPVDEAYSYGGLAAILCCY